MYVCVPIVAWHMTGVAIRDALLPAPHSKVVVKGHIELVKSSPRREELLQRIRERGCE